MKKARVLRVFIFALVVIGLFFSNVCTEGSLAKPLFETGLIISKEASPAIYHNAGDEITYTITIKRTPNNDFRMDKIRVVDNLIPLTCEDSAILNDSRDPGGCAEPRYSGEMKCTGTYTITEEDIAAGEVVNTATVSANYYGRIVCGGCVESEAATGDPVSANISSTITYQGPELNLEKKGSPEYFSEAGEEISYSYLVTNTGKADATDQITVSDDMVDVECPAGSLLSGANMTCTATYITTADDVAAGIVRNTATAFAGDAKSNADSFEVFLEALPAIKLTKSGTPTFFTKAGEVIVFSFTATNIGNVPLSSPFSLSDSMLDEWNCNADISIAPNESFRCNGIHVIQNGEIGQTLNNCASISGAYEGSTISSAEACTDIYYEPPKTKRTSCDIDPNSWDCYCEKNPDDLDCGG